MSHEPVQWYPSKIDWWLVPVLCVPPVAAVAVCVSFALAGSTREFLGGAGTVLLVIGIYLGLVFPIRYGMDDVNLLVRFGLCRQRIPLAGISEVRPTSNPLSAPALSLDRLLIRSGRGFFKSVMISPADRDRFMDELARKAGLKRDGDRLFRV